MPTAVRTPAHRFRAPRGDGQAVIDPAWDQMPALVARNRAGADSLEYDLGGLSLSELRDEARGALRDAAYEHTRAFCDPPPPDADAPLIVSGHQPELFHAGVWFKNFALGALSRECGAVGVHLIIDSDLCRATSVRAPTGPVDAPRVEAVPYDAPDIELPHEERAVRDHSVLAKFPERLARVTRGLTREPLAERMWPDVTRAADRTGNLGLAVSEARRLVEGRWGGATLETPMSRLCDTRAFRWFSAHLLAHAADFRNAYNDTLDEHRVAHNIRTPAQPMPDLHADGEWLEAPLWAWSAADPRRRPLYVKVGPRGVSLTDRTHGEWRLDAAPDAPLDKAAEQLAELRRSGVKLRPRALTTTLFTRLCVADLFLHGIGGAAYDAVTDRIAQRFFGFAPPPHATLSATFRLPIEHELADPQAPRRLTTRLRELTYHPEWFLESADGRASELLSQKRRWVETAKTPANAAQRHREITGANEALQPFVSDQRAATERALAAASRERRAAAVLDSREYSFCLFPEDALLPRMLKLLDG